MIGTFKGEIIPSRRMWEEEKEVKRQSKDATWNPFNRWTSRNLSLAAIVGALNIALIQLFAPLSWGPMQFRIAEVITVPFIMVAGYPAALSLLVTTIVSAFISGMGMSELIWNLATFILWGVASVEFARRLPFNTLGYQLLAGWVAVITGLWVPTMLTTMFGVPWLPLVIWITAAELITMNGIGYVLFLSIKNTGILNSVIGTNLAEGSTDGIYHMVTPRGLMRSSDGVNWKLRTDEDV